MEFTEQRNNLYDSVINEIEKLNDYHKILTKFTNDDIDLIAQYNNDPDLIRFIHLKSYDIITDKMLRAFVNIERAVTRNYWTIIKQLQSEKITKISYLKELFYDLYREINKINDRTARGKLYNREINELLNKSNFLEYIEYADSIMKDNMAKYDESNIIEGIPSELIWPANRCYSNIKNFFGIMKTQMESKPYYNQSLIVMKNVFFITVMVSDAMTTITLE